MWTELKKERKICEQMSIFVLLVLRCVPIPQLMDTVSKLKRLVKRNLQSCYPVIHFTVFVQVQSARGYAVA
jgi:hypothetical protein